MIGMHINALNAYGSVANRLYTYTKTAVARKKKENYSKDD